MEFEYPTTASPFTTVYLTINIMTMNMIIVKIMTIAAAIIAIIMIVIAETVEKSSCLCRLLSDLNQSVYKDADDNVSWQGGSFLSFPACYICGYFLDSGQLWVKNICVNTKSIQNTVNNSSKIAQRRLWKLVKWVLMTLNSKNTIPYTHPEEKFCSKGLWFQNIFFLIQLSFALPIRAERC